MNFRLFRESEIMKKPNDKNGGKNEIMAEERERIPLHRQIRDTLRHEIIQGTRPPYTELPSEQELANLYNTTRMTVRQAIAALEYEGLIEKAQGRRTVVCPPKEVEPIFVLPHDDQFYHRAEGEVTYQLLHQDLIIPSNDVRECLQLPWTVERVIRISRIRIIHDVPVSVYTTYLRTDRCESLLNEQFGNHSLVQTMRGKYGIIPTKMIHEMEILMADEEVSELLNIREKTQILLVESVEYDERDVPFSYNIEKFRADRYRFKIVISNPQT